MGTDLYNTMGVNERSGEARRRVVMVLGLVYARGRDKVTWGPRNKLGLGIMARPCVCML